VWIGYDNAGNKRRTLGGGATGGGVAVPIFEPVMRAAWNDVAPRTTLAPPSPEAKRHLSCASVDKSTTECLRTDNKGKIIDTTTALETGSDRYAKRDGRRGGEDDAGKRKVAHEHRRERATSVARQATTQQQWGWGGGNGWYGAAAPTTSGWSYRW
jgi:penicillin-binding protein 1A